MLAASALAALLLAVAPAPVLPQDLPNLGSTERSDLSPVMERKLGEQIMRDIRRDRDYLDDAPLLEYLNNFGASLVAARPEVRGESGFDFFFFAVRDPALNAFALPGGFVAVHSGLLLAAQNESELASVMAHEIGHVAQRHIARMIGSQKQDALIPLASLVLAALAARSSPDLASASMMGGQGLAMQRQLNFSRDAEREADRVGLEILKAGRFDTSGMIAFFGRLQSATRVYGDGAPPYLRSHPMTTERIADIESRIRGQRYRQHADSLDFQLIRARVRILQDDSAQGLRDASVVFNDLAQQKNPAETIAAKYGLALVAQRQANTALAENLLAQAQSAARGLPPSSTLASLGIELRLAANQPVEAEREASRARTLFPHSRGIALQYADALLASRQTDEAVRYLRDQAQLYRADSRVQERLARAYSAQGRQALQHMALAESYALAGSLPSALDQLQIARRAADASFYDQSVIDAREREFQARRREEMKEEKEKGR
jgi:predicted Zn-dependent protease